MFETNGLSERRCHGLALWYNKNNLSENSLLYTTQVPCIGSIECKKLLSFFPFQPFFTKKRPSPVRTFSAKGQYVFEAAHIFAHTGAFFSRFANALLSQSVF